MGTELASDRRRHRARLLFSSAATSSRVGRLQGHPKITPLSTSSSITPVNVNMDPSSSLQENMPPPPEAAVAVVPSSSPPLKVSTRIRNRASHRQGLQDITNAIQTRSPARKRKSRSSRSKKGKKAKVVVPALVENAVANDADPEGEKDLKPPVLERMVPLADHETVTVTSTDRDLDQEEDDNRRPPVLTSMVVTPAEDADAHTTESPPNVAEDDFLTPQAASTASTPTPAPMSTSTSAPPTADANKSKKKKKAKGRNGNIYIGVANRISWLRLQEQFGFDNINNFGNFVMSYMERVYEDFGTLHQVAVDVGEFSAQGLAGFKWVNGLPHPVDGAGNFLTLPEVEMNEEYTKKAFEVTFDLCMKRGKFLVDLASGRDTDTAAQDAGDEEDQKEEETQLPAEREMGVEGVMLPPGTEDELAAEDEDEQLTKPLEDSPSAKLSEEDLLPPSATDVTEEGFLPPPAKLSEEDLPPSAKPEEDLLQPAKLSEEDLLPRPPPATDVPDTEDLSTKKPLQEPCDSEDDWEDWPLVPPMENSSSSSPEDDPVPPSPSPSPITFELELSLDLPPSASFKTPVAMAPRGKEALREIIGDVTLESISSPENFTPNQSSNSSSSFN